MIASGFLRTRIINSLSYAQATPLVQSESRSKESCRKLRHFRCAVRVLCVHKVLDHGPGPCVSGGKRWGPLVAGLSACGDTGLWLPRRWEERSEGGGNTRQPGEPAVRAECLENQFQTIFHVTNNYQPSRHLTPASVFLLPSEHRFYQGLENCYYCNKTSPRFVHISDCWTG